MWRRSVVLGVCMVVGCGAIELDLPVVPTANAGDDRHAAVGELVALDGSASEPEGVVFAWALVSRPAGSAAQLDATDAAAPSLLVDAPGDYLVELVVTLEGRESLPDLVSISVQNGSPVAQVACSPSDCSLKHGASGTLQGDGSYDPDGDPIVYWWEQVTSDCAAACPDIAPCVASALPALPSNPTGANTAITAPEAANIDLVYRLTVNDGLLSHSRCVEVPVTNFPPAAILANAPMPQTSPPTNPSNVNEGAQLILRAVANPTPDPDGDAVTFTWIEHSVSQPGNVATPSDIPNPNQAQTVITAPVLDAGPVVVTYRVTVSDGLATASTTLQVTVDDL